MARSRNSAGGSEFVWDLLWSDSVSQPDVVERLVVVDISPVGTTPGSHIGAFIAAMKAVEIPEKVPHSQARKLADKQLSSGVKGPHAPPPLSPWCVSEEKWWVGLTGSPFTAAVFSFPFLFLPFLFL